VSAPKSKIHFLSFLTYHTPNLFDCPHSTRSHYATSSTLLLPRPTKVHISPSAPYSQTPSAYVPPQYERPSFSPTSNYRPRYSSERINCHIPRQPIIKVQGPVTTSVAIKSNGDLTEVAKPCIELRSTLDLGPRGMIEIYIWSLNGYRIFVGRLKSTTQNVSQDNR